MRTHTSRHYSNRNTGDAKLTFGFITREVADTIKQPTWGKTHSPTPIDALSQNFMHSKTRPIENGAKMDPDLAFREALKQIDEYLQLDEIPINIRPLKSAIMFVKYYIINIEGENKEDFQNKPWFGGLYYQIKGWYEETYGAAYNVNEQGNSKHFLGVILIKGLPIKIRIPLTSSSYGDSENTAWLHFLQDIRPDENPIDWLINPPNLEKLPDEERIYTINQSQKISSCLRNIIINTIGVSGESAQIAKFSSGISSNLENAAINIATNEQNKRGTAMWSLQMALEHSLKAFALQKTSSFQQTHDLDALYRNISDHIDTNTATKINNIPHHREMIAFRYNEYDRIDIKHLYNVYETAIDIIYYITQKLDRDLILKNFSILLKKPPWLL